MQGLPTAVKRAVGIQLMMVQNGLDPMDWKPLKAVGPVYGKSEYELAGLTG